MLTFAQQPLPILHTQSNVISIQDGDELRQDYWHIDPTLKPDIYVADKSNQSKRVYFYSDIDTIFFEVSPRSTHDFIVLLNQKDTCFTQIKSGISFDPDSVVKSPPDTIPFFLNEANNMIIQVVLNQQDTLDLMFHTAQGNINITEEASQKINSISFDQSHPSQSWGGQGTTKYSTQNTIQIGSRTWDKQTIWQDKLSGPTSDGKFGPHLFSDQIVEINYDLKCLVIHSHLPTTTSEYEQDALIFKRDLMFLESTSTIGQHSFGNTLLIHSGYGGAILYDDQFANQHQIGKKLEITSESELKDSYGNILKTKKAILPSFSIGKTQFKDVPVAFFEGSIGRQKISVMGATMLKKFNWMINLQEATIYYQPNQFTQMAFGSS